MKTLKEQMETKLTQTEKLNEMYKRGLRDGKQEMREKLWQLLGIQSINGFLMKEE
jgi:hypothetical protein